jgi:hypothetical protein
MKKSTKYILFSVGGLLCIFVLYELAFRFCTGKWGEVNTDTSPISLYYSLDLVLPGKPIETIFFQEPN